MRMNFKKIYGAILIAFVLNAGLKAQIVINELSASNTSVLYDEDGDTPDWIELHNTSSDPILLSDYYISDKIDEPLSFQLPELTLQPGGYTLLFASSKNRQGGELYWETIIREGDQTSYLVANSTISNEWITHDYDDSNWNNGSFGIGYGDDDDATIVSDGTISVFTRTSFTITDLNAVQKMMLHIDFDDAYIVYINGTEVHRENIDGEAPVPFNRQSNTYTEPKLIFGEDLPNIGLNEYIELLVEGENTLAIQVHNYNSASSDLTLIPFLSIAYTNEPTNSRGTANETRLPSKEINYPHTNFKLSSDGETVYLSDMSATIVDSLQYPELLANESFGIYSVDNEPYIFTLTTPGRINNLQGYTARSESPATTIKGGFFRNQVSVSLQNPSIGNRTYFTEDGSIPTKSDEIFGTEQRIFNETKVLKFKTFETGSIPGEVVSETYFIDEEHELPVLSLSTHPDNLWSDESGIYVIGTNGIPGYGYYEEGGANWNQDWEIPVHLEFYEEDGNKAFEVGAGAKIFGAWSRNNPAKSLALFFRGDYGANSLDYQMFKSKDIDSFQALILRNSGNDFSSQGHSMFRDGLMTTLVHDTENDFQAYRATVLYLNGEYWGIHNIREKINEHFIESNSNADSDNIDLIQGGGEKDFPNGFGPIHGTIENYDELISFVTSNDLNDPVMYAEAEEFIDVNSFIDYMASQIYYANTDWPGNNVKAWRSRESNGKWRWILYDTDFGFGLSYGGNYTHNTLNFALEANGPEWPNPPWSTILFRELVESEIFRVKFANRMAGLMNANFKTSYVETVIDSLAGLIESEIPRHMATSTRSGDFGGSVGGWNNQLEIMKTFASRRPIYIENHLTQTINSGGKFGVGDLQNVTVSISDAQHGTVQVNRLLIEEAEWTGEYFGDIDIPVTAIPKPGYDFIEWTGDIESSNSTINVRAGDSIEAIFALSNSQTEIIINEIMYNADEEQESDDWIELYNAGSSNVNLAGWILKDEDDDHEFVLPEGTIIEANDYLVLVKDLDEFQTIYPNIENIVSEIGYGFSGNSDEVRLFDLSGMLVDSVRYDDEDPWPVEADGNGYSLELIDSGSDNTLASSWRASSYYLGSPGIENGNSVAKSEESTSPKTIQLLQNYPNPFNPSTLISFNLPKASNVSLKVYSITGRLVATLLDEYVQNGYHAVRWDASNQASGIYFYTLNVENTALSKRMVLIK